VAPFVAPSITAMLLAPARAKLILFVAGFKARACGPPSSGIVAVIV
jgi:hypothetical protein